MTSQRPADSRFPVGTVLKGHGLDGMVKVKPAMHDPSLLAAGMLLLAILPSGESRSMKILAVRSEGRQLWLALEGITDRNSADALRGTDLAVDRDALPRLPEAGYYLGDLVDYAVVGAEGEALGQVQDAWDLPANDVLQVDRDGVELLIPLIDEFVADIDHDARVIRVKGLAGLL